MSAEPTTAATDAAAERHPAWSAALDDLERGIDDAERTLTSIEPESAPSTAAARWTPPTGLGPLPVELSTRASSVLARQQAVAERLHTARSAVLQHLGAVRTVERSHEPDRPVYLDALG